VNGDLAEMRVQLALKSEGLERLQNIYEENLTILKVSKIENEMLREKQNILKSEFYQMESRKVEEFSQLRAELAVAREQLRNYEAIEKEIDEAVVSVSRHDLDSQNNVLLSTVTQAPTTSKRRMQQAI